MNLLVVAALMVTAPAPAGATATPVCTRLPPPLAAPSGWNQPLDRVVSFRVADLSLREALDRLAAVAHLRISYSSEALQLDRIVCIALDSVPVGDVLAALLEGAGVEPVSAGGDHVVLAPVTVAVAAFPARAPVVLDRLVVTGSPAGQAWRPLSVALNVVEGAALSGRSVGTLAETFNSSVPGLWMWEKSASSLLARYGSIRGTSSFGLSYPKVYIDGIQVANPLLLTQIAPETVERIEVIRGPQGAALYGADAISGVTNIVTRQGTADAGAPRARFRTGVGLASSEFGSNPSVGQDHVLALRAGSNTRSLGLNLEAGGTGAFIPGAYRRQFSGTGTGRSVGARTVLTGTLRFYTEAAGTPPSPLIPAALLNKGPVPTAATGQSVRQFTAGTNLKWAPTDRLTNTLVVGVDGYALDGLLADDRLPIPSAAEAAINSSRGGADRATLHWGTVARLARGPAGSVELAFVGEQSWLYQWTTSVPTPAQVRAGSTGSVQSRSWRNNSGASGQLTLGLADQLFLTGGARLERTSSSSRGAALPMLGFSWVLGNAHASVKLRSAYGKGIRWPETAVRETMWNREHNLAVPLPTTLDPEEQSGVEGGMDVLIGNALSVQVTRYDQTATGLIQRVLVAVTKQTVGSETRPVSTYQMQNVGEISNTGWELQGTARGGPLSLTGTMSFADSRVRKLAPRYTGELAVGQRMLDVPARTMSATATVSTPSWGASVTAYRAEDWIGYDRMRLVQKLATMDNIPPDIGGPLLRQFWMTYEGVTHLRATFTKRLSRGFAASLNGDNLLNIQRGEPDNLTVLPGRTFSLGFRAEF